MIDAHSIARDRIISVCGLIDACSTCLISGTFPSSSRLTLLIAFIRCDHVSDVNASGSKPSAHSFGDE